jgi:hypothetical protein
MVVTFHAGGAMLRYNDGQEEEVKVEIKYRREKEAYYLKKFKPSLLQNQKIEFSSFVVLLQIHNRIEFPAPLYTLHYN